MNVGKIGFQTSFGNNQTQGASQQDQQLKAIASLVLAPNNVDKVDFDQLKELQNSPEGRALQAAIENIIPKIEDMANNLVGESDQRLDFVV